MATLVSAPLPDLELAAQTTLTVDTQDASAVITQLVVHFSQQVPEVFPAIELLPPKLASEPITT